MGSGGGTCLDAFRRSTLRWTKAWDTWIVDCEKNSGEVKMLHAGYCKQPYVIWLASSFHAYRLCILKYQLGKGNIYHGNPTDTKFPGRKSQLCLRERY